MSVQAKPLNEINRDAIYLLCKKLGIVNTTRFINQFTVGYGDYTKERKQLFKDMSIKDIVSEIKRSRKNKKA